MPTPFLTVSVSDEQRAALEAVLPPKQVRQALFQAVKRTINSGRVQVNRRVREEINITKKYADRAISSHDPKGDNPVGVIIISKKRIPLIAFRPSVTKKGVRVTFSKRKPPLFFRHAFKALVKSREQREQNLEGHEGIFLRAFGRTKGVFVGAAGRQKLREGGRIKGLGPKGFAWRLPIEQQYGPDVLSVYGEEGTTRVAREELGKLGDTLQRNLAGQMDRFLNRKKNNA